MEHLSFHRRFPLALGGSESLAKPMRTTTIFLLILGVCLLIILKVCRPNFVDNESLGRSKGLSSWLNYSIEYYHAAGAQEAKFMAKLTNVSPYTVSIDLNDKKFHASFMVKPRTGQAYQVFDREYRDLMLTSIWSEPVTVLAPSYSVTWDVPLTSLVTEFHAPVTEELLSGTAVSSKMIMAIQPKRWMAGTYISDNATQESISIQIP